MNYFLIDLMIQWFIETCSNHQIFALLALKENRELIDSMIQFNKKIRSIDSVQTHGIIFSLENLGFHGILENTMNNKKVNEILASKYKTRAKYLSKIVKKEPLSLIFQVFKNSNNMKDFIFPDLAGMLKEETFYTVQFKVLKMFRLNIIIRYVSRRNGKNVDKTLVLPFDHPCFVYAIQ